MNNKYIILGGIILIILNILYIFKFNNVKNNYDLILKENLFLTKDNIRIHKTNNNLKQNLTYSIVNYNENINGYFTDNNGNKINLNKISTHKNTYIMCRISNDFCSGCNEYAIKLSKKLDCDIFYLISNSKKYDFDNISKSYNIPKNKIISCNNISIKAEKIISPYFLIINKNCNVLHVFIPFIDNKENDLELLNKICSIYC